MLSIQHNSFTDIRATLTERVIAAPQVRTEKWQGKDVSKDPAATTYELRNVCFEVPLCGEESLRHWAEDTGANMPWADDHFAERVSGYPLNPGVQWQSWPWAKSAANFKGEIFNHTYMERLWPRWARKASKLPYRNGARATPDRKAWESPRFGIAHEYGDLESLIQLLVKEPFTRQAYIPLFFPEDTGVGDGGRKPCTLGYQVLIRLGPDGKPQAHIWYPLRSVDLVRHFPDDCYMAVRLLLWIVQQCRRRDAMFWDGVTLGTYAMHMTSLHIFENDRRELLGKV